jgi:hypothetical protein
MDLFMCKVLLINIMKRVFWFDVLNLWKLDLKPAHRMRSQTICLTSLTNKLHSILECIILLTFNYKKLQLINLKV